MILDPFLEPFPERIEPRKLFIKNGTLSGLISLGRLGRLSEYLSSSTGQAEAKVELAYDANKRAVIKGEVKANVQMLCQRCLKETDISVQSSLNMLVITTKRWDKEAVKALPDDIEAVQVDEIEDLDLIGLIEDEIILSLPIVVHHEQEDCNKVLNKLKTTTGSIEDASGNIEEKSNKAFAGLQALKEQMSKD